MRIKAIEPTPSPNTMKLTLSESLPQGTAHNFTPKNREEAPEFVQKLFEIEGVKGIYHVADFIAVERHPKADWQTVLPQVRRVFGEDAEEETAHSAQVDEHYGEVNVSIQMFKGIPMQIKASNGEEEIREGLPAVFQQAAMDAQHPEDNIVLQRKWAEQKPRYGDLQEVAKEVAEEIEAAYTDERLTRLVNAANEQTDGTAKPVKKEWLKVTPEMLDHPDWRKRFEVFEQMNPTLDDLPVIKKALQDEKASMRRLATVYLGMIEDEAVLPLLEEALKDKSVTVRRTAGDCMSDIGSEKAIPAMVDSLNDKNKLVRWRAAMFLYEVGDETAVEALREAEDDPEFEVSMQVKLALARIEGGEEAKGSVWKQMTDTIQKDQ
ncbi:conserved virulence factor C family protein [Alteribacter natronophilus]|uniref:conserved virulence factor C family protein n=1 Tax=Alteribacter natronophilus TaxID=2583810 RepID=UPI00110EFBA0|nr:conserved virulence factor C family protein [Alteribacter natronophilus]TMW73542.1 virulence factor [Alteribacter natronophilus]